MMRNTRGLTYDQNFKGAGFTMVEIMITIALLALVAALVMPGFNGQSRQIVRRHDIDTLKAIHSANSLYSARNNGCNFPLSYDDLLQKCVEPLFDADTGKIRNMNGPNSFYITTINDSVFTCTKDGTKCFIGLEENLPCQPAVFLDKPMIDNIPPADCTVTAPRKATNPCIIKSSECN